MIKQITTSLLAATMFAAMLPAQPVKTDWQKENLKGDVSKIEVFERRVIEEWGEEKEILDPVETAFYGEDGNLTMIYYINYPVFENGVAKRFFYDASGKLQKYTLYQPKSKGNISNVDTGKTQEEARYEYYPDGKIHYISHFQTSHGPWKLSDYYTYITYRDRHYNTRRNYREAKEVWTYTADGYKHISCNDKGETVEREEFTDNGRQSKKGFLVSQYDENGRLVASGATIVANNGVASEATYYGYNDHGDLVIESSSGEAIKEIDKMPWLSANYKLGRDTYYVYSYDNKGNWISRKEYRTLGNGSNAILEKELVRKIEYGQFSNSFETTIVESPSDSDSTDDKYENIYLSDEMMEVLSGMIADYVESVDAMEEELSMKINRYESNKSSWSSAVAEAKKQEIDAIRERIKDSYGALYIDLYNTAFGKSSELSAEDTEAELLNMLKTKYPDAEIIARLASVKDKMDKLK